jgi:hypothetical protein
MQRDLPNKRIKRAQKTIDNKHRTTLNLHKANILHAPHYWLKRATICLNTMFYSTCDVLQHATCDDTNALQT